MDPLIHNSKTNLKLPPFQAAELLIKVSVAAKKYIYRYRNLNIFFFMCVFFLPLQTWAVRCSPMTGDSCGSRDVFGTFTGSSTHEVTLTQTHTHKHPYAPFRWDNNPLSIQGKKIYLYHCNGTFCVKCQFSNVYRQLTGTGFFAAAPGPASMGRCVVLRHLHSSEMQQWQPGGWGEKITKYINKTEGRKRKQEARKTKKSRSLLGFDTVHSSSDNWVLSLIE